VRVSFAGSNFNKRTWSHLGYSRCSAERVSIRGAALALIAVAVVPSRQSWAMQGKHTPVNSSDIQKWTAVLDRACIFMDFVSRACVFAQTGRVRWRITANETTRSSSYTFFTLQIIWKLRKFSFIIRIMYIIIACGLGFTSCIKRI